MREGYVPPAAATPPRERVIARGRDLDAADIDIERNRADRDLDEMVRDPLERAQPGDVLGIEHEGETTSLGDTARDERQRLEDEEEAASKRRREEMKDRTPDS